MATANTTADQVFSEGLLRTSGEDGSAYLDIACANHPEITAQWFEGYRMVGSRRWVPFVDSS